MHLASCVATCRRRPLPIGRAAARVVIATTVRLVGPSVACAIDPDNQTACVNITRTYDRIKSRKLSQRGHQRQSPPSKFRGSPPWPKRRKHQTSVGRGRRPGSPVFGLSILTTSAPCVWCRSLVRCHCVSWYAPPIAESRCSFRALPRSQISAGNLIYLPYLVEVPRPPVGIRFTPWAPEPCPTAPLADGFANFRDGVADLSV